MKGLTPIWSFVKHNKYWIVVIIGVLIVAVLDENSFYQRVKYELEIRDLKAQISAYNKEYKRDEVLLKELRQNPKAITKIARERYFMKADDEDIYVLDEDLETTNSVGDATTN